MVIIPSIRTMFVHIPRTSGTALSRAICQAFDDAVWLDSHRWMHATAADARELFAGHVQVFTIIRNPWAIFESHWGWARRMARSPELLEPAWFRSAVISQAKRSFSDAVTAAIESDALASPGGFFARYCDRQTRVFRYEDQPYDEIAAMLGRPLAVRIENETIDEPPAWDRESAAAIASYCSGDKERFGWTLPSVRMATTSDHKNARMS